MYLYIYTLIRVRVFSKKKKDTVTIYQVFGELTEIRIFEKWSQQSTPTDFGGLYFPSKPLQGAL